MIRCYGVRAVTALLSTALALAAMPPVFAEVLYGIDQTNDQLLAINPDTGAATPIGPLGFHWGRVGASFHAGETWVLGGMSGPLGEAALYTVDTSTGGATANVPIDQPVTSVVGMEFASGDVLFYSEGQDLYSFDLGTGASIPIGTVGIVVANLARSSSDRYYFVNSNTLYELDVVTAVPTPVGPLVGATSGGIGLAFRPSDGLLYTTDTSFNLVTIDPVNAQATVIGPLGVSGAFGGLALAPDGPVPVAPESWGSVKGSFRR